MTRPDRSAELDQISQRLATIAKTRPGWIINKSIDRTENENDLDTFPPNRLDDQGVQSVGRSQHLGAFVFLVE